MAFIPPPARVAGAAPRTLLPLVALPLLLGCGVGTVPTPERPPVDRSPTTNGLSPAVTLHVLPLDLEVSGARVSASFVLESSAPVLVGQVVVAVRGPSGESFDFAHHSAVRLTGPSHFAGSRSDFPPGSYEAWVAYSLDDSTWVDGPSVRFVIAEEEATSP